MSLTAKVAIVQIVIAPASAPPPARVLSPCAEPTRTFPLFFLISNSKVAPAPAILFAVIQHSIL